MLNRPRERNGSAWTRNRAIFHGERSHGERFFSISRTRGARSRIKAARNAWFSHAGQRSDGGCTGREKRTEKKDDHVRFSRSARAVPFAERLSKLLDVVTYTRNYQVYPSLVFSTIRSRCVLSLSLCLSLSLSRLRHGESSHGER